MPAQTLAPPRLSNDACEASVLAVGAESRERASVLVWISLTISKQWM